MDLPLFKRRLGAVGDKLLTRLNNRANSLISTFEN